MAHKKIHLESKLCFVCDKPFNWRKKWQDCWEDVKYCSERCRRNKHSSTDKSILKNNASKDNNQDQKNA